MFEYQPHSDLLQGRFILVTGAGAGIGRAAANCYARHGATVVLLGRTVKHLEECYDEIVAAGGPEPAIYPMNLQGATLRDHQDLTATLEREFGQLHGVLHNAALLGRRTPLGQYPLDEWQKLLQVNLTAAFMMTQALLPLLMQADDASVIFTSSGVGRRGRAYWGAYAVTKFAVEGMAQVWAEELGAVSQVRINSINPGATRTRMRADAYPGEDPARNPAPDEIMPLYLYLMGPQSRHLNGVSLDAQTRDGQPG